MPNISKTIRLDKDIYDCIRAEADHHGAISKLINDQLSKKWGKVNQVRSTKIVKRFVEPTVEEVSQYCTEQGISIDPQGFIDYNQSCGWKVGNKPMKDWKASVRTWEGRQRKQNSNQQRSLIDQVNDTSWAQ